MNKKILICFFCFFIIISLWICFNKKTPQINRVDSEIQEDTFRISKIKYYSSCNAVSNTTSFQNPEWNVNVYEYTDIAIYLERLYDNDIKNYITNLSVSNFELGENENIYYLNPMNFGNGDLDFDNNYEDKIEYNVINDINSTDEQNYNIPIFFQDCSNPITLRFVKKLANNYKVKSDETLSYNGSLINKLGINLQKLNLKFSFDLEIITKDNLKKINKIELKIPLESDEKNILDGDFEIETVGNINI